jgi:hypothetical protein
VFLDAASGTVTVTTQSGNTGCKSLTCTGFTGAFADGPSGEMAIAGGFTFVAGMTVSLDRGFDITGSGTLISAGKSLPPLRIAGSGITVNQGDAFNFASGFSTLAPCLHVISGTYNTNNYNITFNSSVGGGISVTGTNARTLNLGSSTISITETGSSNNIAFFNATTTTNLTFNAGTSNYNCTFSNITVQTPSFIGGGLTFNNVTFSAPISNLYFGHIITGANTFNNLTVNPRASAGIGSLTISANQTVTGTFTLPGNANATFRMAIKSNAIGVPQTITCAAVSLTDVDFQDITGAGAAAPFTGTRLGDAKGNSGITFPAAKTAYWNLAAGGNWNATAWATTSGGTPAIANFPLPQDTVLFEATGLNSGATITINSNYFIGTINMAARTSNTMTLGATASHPVLGNWVNGTGVTIAHNSAVSITFSGRGSQTITSATRSFTCAIVVDSPGGTVTLQDALTNALAASDAMVLTNGTLDLNGQTLTSTFLTATGTKNLTFNGGTFLVTASGATAFNNAVPTGFTTTAGTGTGTINLTSASAKTFVGGGSTYNCTLNQGGAGALTLTGSNTFNNITNTYGSTGATTITFPASATTTVANFTASGTAGRLLTINSSSSGIRATLSKASGAVSVSYLNLKDSAATGGASWTATLSTDGGNNTGWNGISSASANTFFVFFY